MTSMGTWKCGALLAIGAAALLLTAAPGTARAGAEEREDALNSLRPRMRDAVNWTKPNPSYSSTSGDELQDMRESCRDAIVNAKAEGLRGSDVVGDSAFVVHPKAKKVGDDYMVKISDLGWFCDDLETRLAYFDMVQRLEDGVRAQQQIKEGLSADEKQSVSATQVETWKQSQQRCVDSVARELARGLDPDKAIELKGGVKVKPSQAGPLCDAIGEWAGVLDAAFQLRFDELAEKYRAVGINGDRLALFVRYDDVEFYLKGCKSSTSDPAKLKKAKALFQWMSDTATGKITIRKYAFKGDKYKVTEKTFWTDAKAYKGCK